MEEEEFERLEKIQFMINEGYTMPNEDLEWMVKKLRLQDTMLNLMAGNLTAPVHNKEWVLKYYKEEAEKRLCLK